MKKEKFDVYKLTMFEGTTIHNSIDDLNDVLKINIEEMEIGQSENVVIHKIKMTQRQYDNLPEFEGY